MVVPYCDVSAPQRDFNQTHQVSDFNAQKYRMCDVVRVSWISKGLFASTSPTLFDQEVEEDGEIKKLNQRSTV